MKKVFLLLVITSVLVFPKVYGQSDEISYQDLFQMSLEELMNLEIVSVSKRAESTFDAPLSSSVIAYDDIIKSGATTIAEALRLVPGVIVREQTNGVYDIHLRGLDHILPGGYQSSINTITLVMIDNRPVFRDFQGGTYWEALPIDLNDIERIEVVRGPSSSMYGANAVAGIINIITKKPNKNDTYVQANLTQGNFNTKLYGVNAGFRKDNFYVGMSANHSYRNRFEQFYYTFKDSQYTPYSNLSATNTSSTFFNTLAKRYPNPELAVDKWGLNTFVGYTPNDKISIDLSLGIQNSVGQKIYSDNFYTPWITEKSESQYANLQAKINAFMFQASHLKGYQNSFGIRGWEFEYATSDLILEYDFLLLDKKLSVRPGFNYRSTIYDDTLSQINMSNGLINNRNATLDNLAGLLRVDYQIQEKIRLISSIRFDKYNHPSDPYFSFQVGGTFKPVHNHLFRLVASRANKGSTIVDNYLNYSVISPMINIIYRGNKNLNLATTNMIELGYRAKLFNRLNFDAEAFYQTLDNLTKISKDSLVGNTHYYSTRNIDLKASQIGLSLSARYFFNENTNINPFVTFQKTTIDDPKGSTSQSDTSYTHEWTPSIIYGLNFGSTVFKKVQIGIGLYGYTKQTFYYSASYQNTTTLNPALLFSTKLSYYVTENLSVFFNLRNLNLLRDLTNDKLDLKDKRQFAFTDNIYTLTLFGINATF